MQAQSAYTWLRWAHAAMVRDALLRNETPLTTRIVNYATASTGFGS